MCETHLACRTKATMPAARGALAEVPVCRCVHCPRRSVVVICLSSESPELKVVTSVEEQGSEYLCNVTKQIIMYHVLFVS